MSFCVFLLYSHKNYRFLCKFAENNEDMSGESKDGEWMRQALDNNFGETIMVRHMVGTSKYEPKDFQSWKEYWENKKYPFQFPQKSSDCPCCKNRRDKDEFVGAHIEEADNPQKQYIYPICNSCNDRYGEGKEPSPVFEVKKPFCAPFSISEIKPVRHEE